MSGDYETDECKEYTINKPRGLIAFPYATIYFHGDQVTRLVTTTNQDNSVVTTMPNIKMVKLMGN